jgi:FkbM family methyltransferase
VAADSPLRRLAKRVLHPLLNERTYRYLQAGAMAWDIRRGSWAEPELKLVPALVRAGDTAVDVGANYGVYSYHLSHAVGAAGHVYAFEPIPFTAGTFRLVSRLLRFRNVTLFEEGASDRNGEVTFQLPLQDSGALTAGQAHVDGRDDERPGKERHHRYPRTRPVTCPIVRIDDRLPSVRDLSFLKADIEGSELFAFRGAARLIDEHRPTVLCEINTWFLEGFGIPLADLLGFFSERGYRVYKLDTARAKLVPVEIGPDTEDNFLFVHPRRRDRLAAWLAD